MMRNSVADVLETTLGDWCVMAVRLVFRPRHWVPAARLFRLWCECRFRAWRYCRRWGVTRAELVERTRNPWR